MGYDAQTKLVIQVMNVIPGYREFLKSFRRKWTYRELSREQIVIKGQPIADKVILDLDLEVFNDF